MKESIPGEAGLIGITVAVIGTCAVITATSGTWLPWLPCAAGIYVGWLAVKAINK